MRRATIYSVAQACGVSAATVSRAFSRPDVVKADVRERILATAKELGYRTNRAARGLATGRTGMIGLLLPDITNPFFPPLVRAIQQAAADLDASVLLVDAEERPAAEAQLVERLKDQVDGMVIASPRSATVLRDAGELPAVVLNRRFRGASTVVCDNTTALREAGRHLEQFGHRRVALLRGPAASWAARQRATAVRSWAKAARKVTLTDLGPYPATFEGGRDAAAALLGTKCTAAFAFDDLMACGVLSGLAEAGVEVPAGRSVVGCDDVLLARTVTPNLTTVTAPVDELGRTAVEMLQQRIAGEPAEEVRLDGELVIRGSTGPAGRR
jgi:LacI family transcriptional regulator